MVQAKPVITTPVERNNKLVVDGVTGHLAHPEPASLFKKILNVAHDTDSIPRVGQQAQQFVLEKHRWDKYIDQLTNIYESVVAK